MLGNYGCPRSISAAFNLCRTPQRSAQEVVTERVIVACCANGSATRIRRIGHRGGPLYGANTAVVVLVLNLNTSLERD